MLLTLLSLTLNAQEKQEIIDFMSADDYIIGGVTVSGVRFLDTNALIGISGLRIRTGSDNTREMQLQQQFRNYGSRDSSPM